MQAETNLKIFSGNSNTPLAREICQYLEVPIAPWKSGDHGMIIYSVEIKCLPDLAGGEVSETIFQLCVSSVSTHVGGIAIEGEMNEEIGAERHHVGRPTRVGPVRVRGEGLMNEPFVGVGKGMSIKKSIGHISDGGDVPIADILVERRGLFEHFSHVRDG